MITEGFQGKCFDITQNWTEGQKYYEELIALNFPPCVLSRSPSPFSTVM